MLGPVALASEPNNTIKLYTDSNCIGAVAGQGTATQLEGEGIQVTVTANSTTTFYATQSNETESSPCSPQSITYRQVSDPPAAPTFSSVNPASPANDNFPHLIGTADPESTVSIYANPGCVGEIASGSGAEFAGTGIQVSVGDNTETVFYAKASLAGYGSGCSTDSIAYHEVTPVSEPEGGGEGTGVGGATPVSPPAAPHLHTVPGGQANDNSPVVTGSAPGATTVKIYASAECKGSPVAKGSAAALASGFAIQVADNVVVTFSGVSVGPAGQSACSDPVTYVEDSLAPQIRFTMGPGAKTRKRRAVFRFIDVNGNAPGTVYLCKVNRRKWRHCSSPLKLRKLRPSRYVVEVKAVDPAGNVERKPARRRFRVIRRH